MALGQLESPWPIYNVVQHDGAVCVAAGRHAELDGGIFLWGLTPDSGAVRWQAVLHTPPTHLPAGVKSPKAARPFLLEVQQRGLLNGGLAVDGGRLSLRSPYFDKRGSSPSASGYFPRSRPSGAAPTSRPLPLDPAAWHGRTINPQELVELPRQR